GYIADSDPKEDPKEDPTDYPTAGGDDDDDEDDDDDDDESSDDDEDNDDVEDDEDEEEEEHPALADSVPLPVHRVTARMSIRDQPATPFWSEAEIARLLAIPSPLSQLSLPLPQIPLPPLPVSSPILVSPPPLPASPNYPLGYRAAMIRLRAETPSTSYPLPSSTPPSRTLPLLPIHLPTPSPPFLLPSTVYRAGVSGVTLCHTPPRRKREA
ncbi:hypothetical protein Tco_1560151, partial [Tanacetum coccineum]